MNNGRIVFLLTSLATLAGLAGARFLDFPALPSSPDAKSIHAPEKAARAPLRALDLQALTGRLDAGALPPTPEQLKEERRIDNEQVAEAVHSLHSRHITERVGGAQQLAAYPTREAERQLRAALAADKTPEVREAAAQSLAYIEAPETQTIAVLVKALKDGAPEVRFAALQVLEGYLNGLDVEAAGFRRIHQGLRSLLNGRGLDRETAESIRELLDGTVD